MKAQCPECDNWIQLSDSINMWDVVECPQCKTELLLVSDDPYELDYADEYEDDYDDDYDDEEF